MRKLKVCYHMMHGAGTVLAAVHKKLAADGLVEPLACAVTFNKYREILAARSGNFPAMIRHPGLVDILAGKGDAAEYPGRLDAYFERAWKNDRLLRNKNRILAEKVWRASLNRFTKFFAEHKPDIVISDVIQSLPCYALFVSATAAGVPYAQICGARLLNGRMELHNDVSVHPYGLVMNGAVTAENKTHALQYMETLRSSGYSGPSYIKYYSGRKIDIGLRDIAKGFRFLTEYFGGAFAEPTRESFFAPFISKFRAMNSTKIWSDRRIYAAAESVRASTKKKLFFPLHVTPEASTLTWAPQYADMGDTVSAISAHLPEGWLLVAREHPATATLFRSKEELKKILSNKNVLLVSPAENGYALMDECDAMLTVNSTMGMEAMLLGKKVITIGEPFYDISGNTLKCPDLKKLPEKLDAAASFVPDPGRNLSFLESYYQCTMNGLYSNPELLPAAAALHLLSEENISDIAAFVGRFALGRYDDLSAAVKTGRIKTS